MLLALSIGGDDYICKPYPLSVLLAKVRATLKRYGESAEQSADRAKVDTDKNVLKDNRLRGWKRSDGREKCSRRRTPRYLTFWLRL